jgi:hypothetical protein
VIRGRRFDLAYKFLPDGLTPAKTLSFLSPTEKRYFSQVQGRTYANMFGLVERFIELEWRRVDTATSVDARDLAINELIELIAAVDSIVTTQARTDSRYFIATCGRQLEAAAVEAVEQTMLAAYRLQFIFSGAQHPHFAATLASMTTEPQLARIGDALAELTPQSALRAA